MLGNGTTLPRAPISSTSNRYQIRNAAIAHRCLALRQGWTVGARAISLPCSSRTVWRLGSIVTP